MQAKTEIERFVESPSRRRLLEQETLILEATEVLSEIMAKENINKAELAQRLGCSKSYVTQVLNGRANLTLRTLADLGWALGYSFQLQGKNQDSGYRVSMHDVPHSSASQCRIQPTWRIGFDLQGAHGSEIAEAQNTELALCA
jgi:plasmid maintenance system antidote protein VapI